MTMVDIWIVVSKTYFHALNPGTYELYIIYLKKKKIFSGVTKLSILSLRAHPGVSRWALNK